MLYFFPYHNIYIFNYSALIDFKSNLEGENKLLKAFYVTNNVAESLHSKFNSNLPKKSTTAHNFIECMAKVFIDDSIKITNLKRYDIKTKAIVNIIKDYKLYEQYIWIKKEIFKNYEKKLINENEDELKEINSLYKY